MIVNLCRQKTHEKSNGRIIALLPMKRFLSLIILASLTVFSAGCKKNNTEPLSPLAVSFTDGGTPIARIVFGPAAIFFRGNTAVPGCSTSRWM